MFDPGDKVVCIEGFSEWERGMLLWFGAVPPPCAWPEMGRSYVVVKMKRHPRGEHFGVNVVGIPNWYWEPSRFRKLDNYEEPKKLVEKVPELELV
jgi:hypothetical protein